MIQLSIEKLVRLDFDNLLIEFIEFYSMLLLEKDGVTVIDDGKDNVFDKNKEMLLGMLCK